MILAMVSFSSEVGWASNRLAFGGVHAYQLLMLGCSGVALGVGACWAACLAARLKTLKEV